ncbi:hypothetical protein [Erwinia tasmaniensis]|uniref:hypothetical protein n=1 Tax=Erwinia tasmaniensis TaxID=338565 RepID=UPI0002E4333A|nr:hypothetical protein [Erwinia tasmaniensis]
MSLIRQPIDLVDVVLGEKTEIQLKDRNSQRVDIIEWLTEGSITWKGTGKTWPGRIAAKIR